MSEETVQLDQIIPDFTAEATVKPFKLSDYKGKNLIIYFYPKDNTPAVQPKASISGNIIRNF